MTAVFTGYQSICADCSSCFNIISGSDFGGDGIGASGASRAGSGDAGHGQTFCASGAAAATGLGESNDIREIGLAIKDFKKEKQSAIQKEFNYPYFHTDACQTPLYYNLDVSTLCLDGLSLDGLKIGGPKGCGLLFVKKAVSIKPIIFGGGQENGLRSGTGSTKVSVTSDTVKWKISVSQSALASAIFFTFSSCISL
jgi:hypothetical protein